MITINELRSHFDLPPITGGDKLVTEFLTIGNKKWLRSDSILFSSGKRVSKPKRMLRIINR